MDPARQLAPCLVGRGTVSNFRDMLRVLETLENVTYRFIVHGEQMEEGSVALVKLMADSDSSTLIVNGCLFLNVASFRYLDFESNNQEQWVFTLHGDGSILELVALPDTAEENDAARPRLLAEDDTPDFDLLMALEDEDEEE